MRDPARIPEILRRIQAVWEKYPDLRLGQLLNNARTASLGPYQRQVLDDFYIEDEVYLKMVEDFDAGIRWHQTK